jgi:arginyl-tRNA synthetase
MYARDAAKKQLLQSLKKAFGKQYTPHAKELSTPPDDKLGDLTFACFGVAKGLGRNPAEIATEIAAKLAVGGLIKSAVATGPYVNVFLDGSAFAEQVFADLKKGKKKYGTGNLGAGKRILIEYANPNTHKEIHIGHVRNFTFGKAVVNLLMATGYDVTPVSYINDLGNNVAKAIWGLQKFYGGQASSAGEDALSYYGRAYTEASLAIGDNPELKLEVSKIQRELEEGEGESIPLWKATQKASIDGLKAVFAEFGLTFKKIYEEHVFIEKTHAIVKKLLIEGLAQVSEGAVIVDLSAQKLGVNLLRKTDGTLLYNAKDLALAEQKEEDFAPDRSLYVIDTRQSLAMKQLAATLGAMGVKEEVIHLPFDMVTLPEGAMSSRKGNIVRWTDFRDQLRTRLAEETAKRHPTWRTKKVLQNAADLALATTIYTMLRQDPERIITFDVEEAMSVEGNTGPYLLYSLVRIETLLKKAPIRPAAKPELLTHDQEQRLIKTIARYPEVVSEAALSYNPALIAQYAYGLAQEFASYYEAVHITADDDRARMGARLALLDIVSQTLHNALTLLGMPIVKEM